MRLCRQPECDLCASLASTTTAKVDVQEAMEHVLMPDAPYPLRLLPIIVEHVHWWLAP